MTDQSMEHSTRSPSGAHGWRRCAGKINAEVGRPDRVGIEAAQGTMFHDYAEIALSKSIHPSLLPLGEERTISGHLVTFSEEMAEHMIAGWQWIMNILQANPDAILFVEERVHIEPWTLEPGGFGTSDCCIIFPKEREIIVFDWKYGNVPVSPIRNDQLMLYALGCWKSLCGEIFNWDHEGITVRMIINQPRVPGAGGESTMTMAELLDEGQQIIIDAAATYNPQAPRTAGEKQCRYCKARTDCATLAAYNFTLCQLKFKDIDEAIEYGGLPPILPEPKEWTPEHRAYVWLHRATFTNWMNALHDAIIEDLRRGAGLTDLVKVVQGRAGNRAWKGGADAQVRKDAFKMFGAKVVKESIMTPSELEKEYIRLMGSAMGKEAFAEDFGEYVTQPGGKAKLVPATAPGLAIPPDIAQFDIIEEETE